MKKKPAYKSKILKVVHKTVESMYKAGTITDAQLQEFNKLCLEENENERKDGV